jgi:hypothetical protein
MDVTPDEVRQTWAYGLDGAEVAKGDKWDADEDCDNLSALSVALFHPSCWFTSASYLSHLFTCRSRGICYLAAMELRGAEIQAGIVLGSILLVHLIGLSVCLIRLNLMRKGYEPSPDKSVYSISARREGVGAVYAFGVCLWCVGLLVANHGRGQLVGSVLVMLSIAALVVTAVAAFRYVKGLPTEKQPPVPVPLDKSDPCARINVQPSHGGASYGTTTTTI